MVSTSGSRCRSLDAACPALPVSYSYISVSLGAGDREKLRKNAKSKGRVELVGQKQVTRIEHARDLGLPPREEALHYFEEQLAGENCQVFANGLLAAMWDAEKSDDLSPVREWIMIWYHDLRFEVERDLSATLASLPDSATIELTSQQLRKRLGLD